MNILSHIHIHRIPNPSGVGRVIDRMLSAHTELYLESSHRMLVSRQQYDRVYMHLNDTWKMESFIPHSGSPSLQQAKWVWLNKPVAEDFWNDVDIVYCPAESYVPTRKAKLICTIHDVAGFEEDLYPKDRSRQWHCLKWRIMFRQMEKHADAVVTVSEFSAKRIAHFFPGLKNKLRVIYNAPHHIFGEPVDPLLLPEITKLSGGAPFILVPGGLSLRKNADLILDAVPHLAKAMPEVKLIISGSNSAPYLSRLSGMDTSNVILAGYVSDELLNALYQQAAAVWFPSRYEGFGMPAIEAMAAGAPVVASRAASIPEVVGDAALLCEMDDPTGHVEALRSIVESDQIRADLCARSEKQSGIFTWNASAQKLEALFQSL